MLIEVITVGNEILDGRIADTNTKEIAKLLKQNGLKIHFSQSVDDDIDRLNNCFAIAQQRSEKVIVTGGLGPTQDDLSAQAFSQFLKVPLKENKEARSELEKKTKDLSPNQLKQVWVPESSNILANPNGTAPGFSFQKENTEWFFLPGIPSEMTAMLKSSVLPNLNTDTAFKSYFWYSYFTRESELAKRLNQCIESLPSNLQLSYRTKFPENHINLYGSCPSREDEEKFLEIRETISELLKNDTYYQHPAMLPYKSLAEKVAERLIKKKISLTTVESCTGGLIADLLTNVPGSSHFFIKGTICYNNKAKTNLGLSEHTLKEHGAVSSFSAEELSLAGLEDLKKLNFQDNCVSVSTTGIAGPTGASPTKPLGLCYIAISGQNIPTSSTKILAPKTWSRQQLKRYFSFKALELLMKSI